MKFFDFFSGIGGFRLGMEMAGHECVGHCEIDKYADMSYRAMHDIKESEVFFSDIRTVDPSDMPEADCYCFGFPCQAFSISGIRRGLNDTRGTLFFEVMRIAKERKPAILYAENVAGLLNHDGGATFTIILSTLADLGYAVEWQVLNSRCFGVPQNRERVFIVGHYGNERGSKVFPIQTENSGVGVLQIAKLKDKNRDNPNRFRVYDPSGIAPCLTTMDGGGREPYVLVDGKVRKLTPKECFRLQGFPDDYYERAAQVCSDSQLYKQIGNSVTVNVVYEIAKRLESKE
jgi:DNA (cytosine-5)-methyltransferase 1